MKAHKLFSGLMKQNKQMYLLTGKSLLAAFKAVKIKASQTK